jgi:hypothetical protein
MFSNILEVSSDSPRLKSISHTFKKPLEIFLIFKCKSLGASLVTMELDFKYGLNQSKSIPISFIKECTPPQIVDSESSWLGDIFYYTVCFLGIYFGIYLTRKFKS